MIIIQRMGLIDTPELLKVTTTERITQYIRYVKEFETKIRFPICSEIAGKRIETALII
jgi:hypothetical protein